MYRPTGITVLSILYILGGIGLLALSLGIGAYTSGMNSSYMNMFAAIGSLIALATFVGAIMQFIIAGAMLSGKNSGRIVVIIFTILHLLISAGAMFGNGVSFVFVLFDIAVLWYMWQPHVISYFQGYRRYNVYRY